MGKFFKIAETFDQYHKKRSKDRFNRALMAGSIAGGASGLVAGIMNRKALYPLIGTVGGGVAFSAYAKLRNMGADKTLDRTMYDYKHSPQYLIDEREALKKES